MSFQETIEWKKPDQFAAADRAWTLLQDELGDYGIDFNSYDGWHEIDDSNFRFRIISGKKALLITVQVGWDADVDDGNWRDCSRIEAVSMEEDRAHV